MTLNNKGDNKAVDKVKTLLTQSMVKVNIFLNYNNGKIIENCEKQEDVTKIKGLVDSQIKKQFSAVEIQSLKNPRLKVLGIENSQADENLEADIKTRNDIRAADDDLKVVHKYINNNTNTTTAVLEVTQEVYKQIKREKKIYVGWQRCVYHDDFRVNMCNKCCRYSHSLKKK